MNLIIAAIAAPVLGAALGSLSPRRAVRLWMRLSCAAIAVALACATLPRIDRLSALFVAIISIVSFFATLFSCSIFPKIELPDAHWASRPAYFMLLGAFWSSMLVVVYATSFAGIWIGISATTLATTFLVGFSGGKTALEAAWKYLILCSFGIAIALLGILLLGRAGLDGGMSSARALEWTALAARGDALPAPLVKVALLLMTLGFATKAGLVPMHAWLPDAHSKAPAPISALLSGLLVSCSLYAIIRVQSVAHGSIASAVDGSLLVLGSLSVIVAALLMLAQRDVKRFLSYSTVEHSGLAALALGIHTPLAAFAALYHIVNHAFSKAAAFLAVGVVQYAHRSTEIRQLHGLWKEGRGKLLLASLVALAGLPPFGMFLSEFLIVVAAVQAHQWAVLSIALTALALSFTALARLAIDTESDGRAQAELRRSPRLALTAVGGATIVALLCAFIPFARILPQ